jgi:hypothetical protein
VRCHTVAEGAPTGPRLTCMVVDKSPIALIDLKKGEQTAQACAMACLQQPTGFRYISTMTRAALSSLVLVAVLGTLWSNASPAPFSLAVVPSRSFGDRGMIAMSHGKPPQDFYVVLTNVSKEPQSVWELWNSWGYQTISFELTTANGKKFALSRAPEGFTKNNPTTFEVQPGEHQVYAIHLDKGWVSEPACPKDDEMPITLKAVYQASPTREATEHKVWTGRVESHAYSLMLRQW